MLRPGDVARPALARAFTTKLSWAGSPQMPMLVMTEWLIVIYHCRYFTGWTGSLMGCEQRAQRREAGIIFSLSSLRSFGANSCFGFGNLPLRLSRFCGSFGCGWPRWVLSGEFLLKSKFP